MKKYIPSFFKLASDGGPDSGVKAFFIIEWKAFFSIAILRFSIGSREAFHSHAFNAITWWLKGCVTEYKTNGDIRRYCGSLIPKITPRNTFHMVVGRKVTYALTFRGPWKDTWQEYKNNRLITLTHGRKIVHE